MGGGAVIYLALATATAIQLLAGTVRVRGWFHVIRHSCPEGSSLRYRDVAVAHLGGCGWNAVLPARAGDAVKVALIRRRMPATPVATLACTLVAPALVDVVFSVALVGAIVAGGVVSAADLTPPLPGAGPLPAIGAAVLVCLVGALILRRRGRSLVREARAGLAVVGRPAFMAAHIVPWQAAARALRLLALVIVLLGAGVPFAIGPALALMALQGATPSVAPAATALRIALLAGVLAGTSAGDVAPGHVAAVLVAWYAVSSVTNLAASAVVTAWVLRTVSPGRIIAYARSSFGSAAREPGAGAQPPVAPPVAPPVVP